MTTAPAAGAPLGTAPVGYGRVNLGGLPPNPWNEGSAYGAHGYPDDAGSERSTMLNERVQRLQGKISGIEQNIEMSKNQQIEEYERKVTTLEDKFDDIIDQTEKQFDVMLND